MRVLLISDHADPLAKIGSKEAGGQNVYVANVARQLIAQGCEVDVYTRWDTHTKKDVVIVCPGLRVIRVKAGPKAYIKKDTFFSVIDEFVAGIKQRIQAEELSYDILFSHYWFSGVIGLKLAGQYGLPQTHIYHSIGQMRLKASQQLQPEKIDTTFYEMRDKWERRIAHKSTEILATSPIEKDVIVKLFGVPPGKVAVATIGVDTQRFRPLDTQDARLRLQLPPSTPTILYVGRLEQTKGISTLLGALHILASKGWSDVQLYVVGGGNTQKTHHLDAPELVRLRSLTKELGLEKRVHFLGARPQSSMALYYSAADVCAVPSYYESFGIVPIESMACGTHVVATRTGGMLFTVKEGVTGHLVEPRDEKDLADKLALALKRGKTAYSKAAREHILERFSWATIGESVAARLRHTVEEYVSSSPALQVREAGVAEKLYIQKGRSGRRWAIFTDIDDTLVARDKSPQAEAATHQLKEWSRRESIPLILASGTTFTSVHDRIQRNEIPLPDGIISSAGTAVWTRRGMGWKQDPAYNAKLVATGYQRNEVAQKAAAIIKDYRTTTPQVDLHFQHPQQKNKYLLLSDYPSSSYKVSLHFFGNEKTRARIQQDFAKHFPAFKILTCEEIYHNANLTKSKQQKKYCLDIVPLTKADAVAHLVKKLRIDGGWKAGDSGNDSDMLLSTADPLTPIIVGGYKADLAFELSHELAELRLGLIQQLKNGRLIYLEISKARRAAQSIQHATQLWLPMSPASTAKRNSPQSALAVP